MILFIFFMVLAFVLYAKDAQFSAFAKIIVSCGMVLVAFLFEFHLGRVDFLISDGFRYYNRPEDWIVNIDRALWGYLNYFLKYFDIKGDFFIKIINVPILLIVAYLLSRVFEKIKNPFAFVIACPSILYLSISNLRDLLIWVMAILVMTFYFKKKPYYIFLCLITSLLLYALRPFMLVTAIGSIFIFEVIFPDNFINAWILFKKRIVIAVAFVFVGLMIFPIVRPKIDSYVYNGRWLLESGYVGIANQKGVGDLVDSSNVPKALGFAAVRYIMTPQPDSIIRRWLDVRMQGSPYGFISELLRLFNQVFSYLMIGYLVLNFRSAISVLKRMNSLQKSILLWFFLFMPIYSFVHFGGSHQRLKIPFQLFIFVLFYYTYKSKKLIQKRISI